MAGQSTPPTSSPSSVEGGANLFHSTLQGAILRGDPQRAYASVHSVVLESKNDIAVVDEADIRHTRRLLGEDEGLSACVPACPTLAGLVVRASEPEDASVHWLVCDESTGWRLAAGYSEAARQPWGA